MKRSLITASFLSLIAVFTLNGCGNTMKLDEVSYEEFHVAAIKASEMEHPFTKAIVEYYYSGPLLNDEEKMVLGEENFSCNFKYEDECWKCISKIDSSYYMRVYGLVGRSVTSFMCYDPYDERTTTSWYYTEGKGFRIIEEGEALNIMFYDYITFMREFNKYGLLTYYSSKTTPYYYENDDGELVYVSQGDQSTITITYE